MFPQTDVVTQAHCRELSPRLDLNDWKKMLRTSGYHNMVEEIESFTIKSKRERSYQALIYLKDKDKLSMGKLRKLLSDISRKDLAGSLKGKL